MREQCRSTVDFAQQERTREAPPSLPHWPGHRSSMRLFQNTLKLLQAKKSRRGGLVCGPGLRAFNEDSPGFLATLPSFPTTLEDGLSDPSRLQCWVAL